MNDITYSYIMCKNFSTGDRCSWILMQCLITHVINQIIAKVYIAQKLMPLYHHFSC